MIEGVMARSAAWQKGRRRTAARLLLYWGPASTPTGQRSAMTPDRSLPSAPNRPGTRLNCKRVPRSCERRWVHRRCAPATVNDFSAMSQTSPWQNSAGPCIVDSMATRPRAHIDPTETATIMSATQALWRRAQERLSVPPWVLLVEVFIGIGWLRAVVEKVIDPSWWDGTVLSGFLVAQADHALPWYGAFLDGVVEPNLVAVSIAVVFAQLFAAVSLLSGWRLLAGLATGAFLNLNFIAAGAVNPSIFYLICQGALVLWILHGWSSARKRPLRLLATGSLLMVALNMPFISTVDPAEVIEDPAMVLITLGILTATASRAGIRHPEASRTDHRPPAQIDAR